MAVFRRLRLLLFFFFALLFLGTLPRDFRFGFAEVADASALAVPSAACP